MTAMKAKGLGEYGRVNVHSGVESASPHRLIEMLLEGAQTRIATALGNMQRSEIAEKGSNISMAISIVEGLRASLDLQAGGELASNLDDLYEYMGRRLLEANITNDPTLLDEVQALLAEIRAGWTAIAQQVAPPPAETITRAMSV